MKEKRVKSIELPAEQESFEEAQLFIRQRLEAEAISKELISETMIVFENSVPQSSGTGDPPRYDAQAVFSEKSGSRRDPDRL